MKIKKIWRNEAGLALPIVLILLLFGGLLVAPSLAFMSTNLKAGSVVEQKTQGFYAAEAGIEDVLWKLRWGSAFTFPYNLSDSVNGMDVTVSEAKPRVGPVDGVTNYYVKSTAKLGGKTKGEIVVQIEVRQAGGWGGLFENAITSRGSVTIQPGAVINGNVQVPSEDKLINKGTINGERIYAPPAVWPTAAETSAFYLGKVNTANPYPSNSISISELAGKTPLYRNGDLTITGEGAGTLNGVIYVTGQLTINPKKGSSINLNNQAIYSNYYDTNPNQYALNFQPDVTINGSGSIVARGSINFQPKVASVASDFVFVMSIDSKTWFKPSGTFYGSAAGDIEVDVWPGTQFYGPQGGPGGNPNFPPGPGYGPVSSVRLVSYSIAK